MSEIIQHIPNFCSGIEPDEKTFSTKEELLDVWFVKNYTESPGFFRMEIDRDNDRNTLMAIYNGGKTWWVVGFIFGDVSFLDLKEWGRAK